MPEVTGPVKMTLRAASDWSCNDVKPGNALLARPYGRSAGLRTPSPPAHYLCVDHRRRHVAVPQQFMHRRKKPPWSIRTVDSPAASMWAPPLSRTPCTRSVCRTGTEVVSCVPLVCQLANRQRNSAWVLPIARKLAEPVGGEMPSHRFALGSNSRHRSRQTQEKVAAFNVYPCDRHHTRIMAWTGAPLYRARRLLASDCCLVTGYLSSAGAP
jgi:hypothetical protein